MRASFAAVFSIVVTVGGVAGCGGTRHGTGDDDATSPDACAGLQCAVVNCAAMNAPPTSISGTVFAPNGTLPLYGIDVYVPNTDPGPVSDVLACGQCATTLPGNPIAHAISDEAGHFTLSNVPSGDMIPLVISTGKWRRTITIPHIDSCADHPLTAEDTRLPKNRGEAGNIPKIAITTGNADSLECLIRKLGIDDKEIGNQGDPQRVHLYNGNGVASFKTGFPGGSGTLTDAQQLWGTFDALKLYDIVIFSCEGSQNSGTKPQTAMDAVKKYADLGGRVFASHWHNVWIGGAFADGAAQTPAVWNQIAQWTTGQPDLPDGTVDTIDEVANPKGASFATWMTNVMGSPQRDQIPIVNSTGRITCQTVNASKAEQWVYNGPQSNPLGAQNFQFTTPNENPVDTRCGKVVFSDMHVSGGPGSGDYPDSCGTETMLTPQEKALAFMFFDISSCVGQIF